MAHSETKCRYSNFALCPSARNLKVLLKRIAKVHENGIGPTDTLSETDQNRNVQIRMNQILESMLSKYQYSATKLLDDLHHMKSEHGIDDDDAQFDAAFEFFKTNATENGCDINQCPLIRRHYRDRNVPFAGDDSIGSDNETDEVLMDIVAMIHCHLLHSFDINRLTKEERDRVEVETSYGVGLEDDQKEDNPEVDNMRRIKLIGEILNAKQKKLDVVCQRRRFRDEEYGKSVQQKKVNFAAMAQVLGEDETMLREWLSGYQQDRDRLIGDLIDVVYGHYVEDIDIWKGLNVNEDQKNGIFRKILHEHFKCTQLSTSNMVSICRVTAERMELKIDGDALKEVLTDNHMDGRIYDKSNQETHHSVNAFAQKFKSIPNCYGQHIRRMYNVIRKWKYIKSKKEKALKKQEEAVDDGKEDEKEPTNHDDEVRDQNQMNQRHAVYEIGKQFYFWDSLKRHPHYVKAKHENMKEEVMHSPLLDGLVSMSAWNKLTKDIAVLIATEYALRITSNGISFSRYGIQQFEPLDAQHLRALKLYTDFNKLCGKFCDILRCGDIIQIQEIVNMTRNLVETVQCYGTPLSKSQTYHRGVNRSFIFRTIATKFNLPFSTTSSVK